MGWRDETSLSFFVTFSLSFVPFIVCFLVCPVYEICERRVGKLSLGASIFRVYFLSIRGEDKVLSMWIKEPCIFPYFCCLQISRFCFTHLSLSCSSFLLAQAGKPFLPFSLLADPRYHASRTRADSGLVLVGLKSKEADPVSSSSSFYFSPFFFLLRPWRRKRKRERPREGEKKKKSLEGKKSLKAHTRSPLTHSVFLRSTLIPSPFSSLPRSLYIVVLHVIRSQRFLRLKFLTFLW